MKAVFGRPVDDRIGRLKYQLLTGLAGALIEAKSQSADYAVFIVHEFISSSLDAKKMSRNAGDFQRFFEELTGISGLSFGDGKLHEIKSVPGIEAPSISVSTSNCDINAKAFLQNSLFFSSLSSS